MSYTIFTPKDIKELRAKHPLDKMFKLHPEKTRTNADKQQMTYYVPYSCITATGTYATLRLKFNKQIIASNAKLAASQTKDPSKAKNLLITFRRLTIDDLAKTQYKPEQYEKLIEENHELCDALDIIADAFKEMTKTQIREYEGDKFEILTDKEFSIRQIYREPTDQEKDDPRIVEIEDEQVGKKKKKKKFIPLDTPMYRIKLPLVGNEKLVGRLNKEKVYQPIVFDQRKCTKENKYKEVPAKVVLNGKPVNLDMNNAKHFVSYMSLIGGDITFDDACSSKMGISQLNKFNKIHVVPHPPMTIPIRDEQDELDMNNFGSTGYKDDIVVDEPEDDAPVLQVATKSKGSKSKQKQIADDGEEFMNSDEESTSAQKDSPKKNKQTRSQSPAVKKTNKSQKAKTPDDEPDDNQDDADDDPKSSDEKEADDPDTPEDEEENEAQDVAEDKLETKEPVKKAKAAEPTKVAKTVKKAAK